MMTSPRRAAGLGPWWLPALLSAGLAIWLAIASIQTSGARFVGSAQSAANTVRTASWYFLHNSPTPPTANTAAVANLAMDTTTPTQATLYNYDTNADSLAGRRIQKSGTGPGDTTLARYANWRSAAFTSARSISGTAVLRIWAGITGFPLNKQGVLIVYLRDYNPTAGTYAEIANATLTDANWQGGVASWVQKSIAIPISSYTVPSTHRLEVKLETTAAASSNMVIAYDTTVYPASLSLP